MNGPGPAPRRLFFALWPTRAERAALQAAQRATVGPETAVVVPGADLHLTLLFLGDVSAAQCQRLCRGAARLRAPRCRQRLDRVKRWGSVQCLCGSAESSLLVLREALGRLAAAAGLAPPSGPFRPHVTLARRAQGRMRSDVPGARRLWLRPRRFCLVESRPGRRPGRYRVLAHWPLG